jgi:hypothetical protein
LTSEKFLNLVTFHLIPDVGVPLMMISDRGSNLISELCHEFYEHFGGIEPRIADAHMHTAVGLTERFNSTLREMSRAAYFDTKAEWDLYLPYVQLFYNATVQESTGFSPYFIEHGREPTLPWHATAEVPPQDGSVSAYVRNHLLGVHMAWEAAVANLQQAEARRKEEHDGKYRTDVVFQPGDRVLLLQPGRRNKMEMPYVGPFRILWGPDERDRYALRDLYGRRYHNVFHVSKLKLWPLDDDIEAEHWEVLKILDGRRGKDGELEGLVRWRGWSKKYDSWEPWEHLNEAARDEVRAVVKEKERVRRDGVATNEDATNAANEDAAAAEGEPSARKTAKKKQKDKNSTTADPAPQQDKGAAQMEARAQRAAAREARGASRDQQ